MPLTGNFAGLRRLRRGLESVAEPEGAGRTDLVEGVQAEVKELLAEEFEKGIGPTGEPWQETVRGKPALVSRKLVGAFSSRIDRGIVRFTGKSKRDMLLAHQFGHTFPARKVAAEKQHLSFNSKGKLVAARRIFKKDGTVRRGGYQRFAAAHTVHERTLPARPIYPDGAMPPRWEERIQRGIAAAMERLAARWQK
jgi:hypothetical protein